MNVDEHDGWRTAAALLSSAVLGIVALGATFWVFTGVVSSSAVGASQAAVIATPGDTSTTIPDVPTTSATTIVVPSPTVVPFTPAPVNVAPPELPTMTAPVPGATADPAAAVGSPASPGTVQPPSQAPPAISGVSMFCRKNGDRVEGGLSFSTTSSVPVLLMVGGKVTQQDAAGPGAVSVTAVGKRGSFCMATVGSQRIGPIAAS